jgi:hypothetical protein
MSRRELQAGDLDGQAMRCRAVEHLFSVCLSERRSAESCRHLYQAHQRCHAMLDKMDKILMRQEDEKNKMM